jgi:hypothetical protein
MPITTKDWRDLPDTSTPITAAALEDLESRLGAYADSVAGGGGGGGIDVNVKTDYGAKGDVRYLSDGAMTSASNALSSTSAAFTNADIDKSVCVLGAGALWNARGAWVASTSYAVDDTVTKDGLTWACNIANSDSIWQPTRWEPVWRTRKSLGGWIKTVVGGVANLMTTKGGSTPANASATVSGKDFYYGTDDSAAFQSMGDAIYAAGGGRGIVPRGDYIVMNVDFKAFTNIEVANGTRFRLPGVIPFGPALFYMSQSAATADQYMRFGSEGFCIFDFTGIDPSQFMHGIFAGAITDYVIEGIYMLNSPDGNAVTTYPTGASSLSPDRGKIDRIYSKNSPWGFGPVQVDGMTNTIITNVWSDLGRAVNFETDNSGPAKLVEGVTVDRVRNDHRATMSVPNSAVGLIAHGYLIRDVSVKNVMATGSADGIQASNDSSVGLDHILVDNVRVTGGGRGYMNSSTDVEVIDLTVRNVEVDGSAVFNPFASAYDPGINYCPGQVLTDCRVDRSLGPGFQAMFHSVSILGCSKHFRCRSRGNTVGWDNRYMSRLELESCEGEDNPLTSVGPFTNAQLDLQIGAGNWVAATGTTATRQTGTANRWIKLLSNGTTSTIDVTTPTGTSGFPVTVGTYYQFSCVGQSVVGTLQELRLQIIWYTSGGSVVSTSTGATVTLNSSTAVSSYFTAVAPATAAFAAVRAQSLHNGGGTNFANNDEARVVPLAFGKVAGAGGTQTYGVKAAQGVDVVLINTGLGGNTTGRVDATGTPVIREFAARDILVIS